MIKTIIFCCSLFSILPLSAQDDKLDFRKRANITNAKISSDYTEDDVKAEITYGRNLAARILGQYKEIQNQKVINYVATVGTGLSAMFGRPELKYYFTILDLDDVNAYACPGGYIFITKGALSIMSNEAELAGVLAHEISHINQRHVVKQLYIRAVDNSFSSNLASFSGGSTASVRLSVGQLMNQGYDLLFEKGIKKSDELEADSLSAQYISSINYSLKSYENYLDKVEDSIKKGAGQVVYKTHPSIKERKQKIALEENNSRQNYKTNTKRFIENVKL